MFKNKEWVMVFVLISLILFSIKPVMSITFSTEILSTNVQTKIDPAMKEIYVPPAQNSHTNCCPHSGRLKYPNTWEYLPSDNNIPGFLPGPRRGEQLGLEGNPGLNLSDPIRAPLLNPLEDLNSRQVEDNILKGCLRLAKEKSSISNRAFPVSLYYKYRFQQCNPYNGSYCQCTNNYIPLQPVGLCQSNGWNEDVCPNRVKPSTMYLETQKCLISH